jgi:RNA polymerase sigma-70 factor (ECF subfamily)
LQPATITCGNHSDLETLYATYRDAVYRVAFRVTRNAADAEDIVQGVFLRMLRNEVQPDPRRSPAAYLKRAAANASIDLIRQRTQRSETTIPRHHAAAEDTCLSRVQVGQTIATLTPSNARLFVMHYDGGYPCQELADHFQMQTGTVKSRLHRIRASLQKQFQAA